MKPAARRVHPKARWAPAPSRIGGDLVALAVLSACASGGPSAAPRANGGPYLAARPEAFAGKVVGTGQCVDLVKAVAGAPQTAEWRRGAAVRGNRHIRLGTAIATFKKADGTYTSRPGNHAAIYLGQDATGIWVYDPWWNQPVHKRLIRFEGGGGSERGSKSSDGKRFAVIG